MTVLPIKPASFAGFLLLGAVSNVAPVGAQDYVDVEAERRAAAKQAPLTQAPLTQAPITQAPLEEASEVAPATSYTGIQPYSGSTTSWVLLRQVFKFSKGNVQTFDHDINDN